MNNNKEMVYDIIQATLDVAKEAITHVERTPGGETNESYFATVAGKEYVVRLPGKGTEVLIDRAIEKENLTFGTKLGINPAFVYFDEASGIKISHAIEAATPLTQASARDVHIFHKLIHLFQTLHETDDVMSNRFDLFQKIHEYEQLAFAANSVTLQQITNLSNEIHALQQVYESYEIVETPCHMDSVIINILQDKTDNLYLIDWEYSGMFDPLWDIATLSLSLELNEEEEHYFLTNYFRREPTVDELQRLHLLKIFLDYYWSLWYIYKETKGDNFGNKGTDRIHRAKHNLTTYKMEYEVDVVVGS